MSFKQFLLFATDATGLEKLLRLLQCLSQILSGLASTSGDVLFWNHTRRQFALGRRYLRFFRVFECISRMSDVYFQTAAGGWEILFGVLKWGFLGGFLGLESLTLLDAMGVYPVSWAARAMLEANKLWFYSLVCSIALGILQLSSSTEDSKSKKGEKSKGKAAAVGERGKDGKGKRMGKEELQRVKIRLVADCFDLLVPGYVTGWIPVGTVVAGFAGVVSTTLSSKDIWDRFG